MTELLLYADYMSQPSRAVMSLCYAADIPFKLIEVRVLKGETFSEDFKKISPSQTVPTLVDGKITLYESHSILTYLATKYSVADNWYPKDLKYRSLVNNYLHWHHLNIRFGCGMYLFNKYAAPKYYGRSSEDLEQLTTEKRDEAFGILNETLAKGLYVAGTPFVTIADLSAYSEIIALKWTKFDFSKYPSLEKWLQEMGNSKPIQESHRVFEKFLPRVKL